MTKIQIWANILGALSVGASGSLACDRGARQATEVPAAGGTEPAGECLHSEGCCGGHKEGDDSCGGERVAAEPAEPAEPEAASADEPAPQSFAWIVEPGKAVEINVELAAGATMTARFRSDARLAWNVHSHPGDAPTIHAEGSDAAGERSFAAEAAGVYSYLWVNKGSRAVELAVELRIDGAGRVHSTHP